MFEKLFLITFLLNNVLSAQLSLNEIKKIQNELTEAQIVLYNRIKFSKYVNNPYKHLNASQVCIGTSDGFSSSSNDFPKWKAHFSKCVYVEGNVEINNFNPNEPIEQYDFSFLDDIKEITGYLLIHNTRLKSIRFKSLQLIRGKNLITDNKISLFIDNNAQLEHLDLSNLKEIQRGNVFIQNNPRLCHMNEVNWSDIMTNDLNSIDIKVNNNADPSKCEKCLTTCCSNDDEQKCGCWFPNGCQRLSKSVCHNRCGGNRCYGNGPFDCCSSQCSGGCSGPANNDCIACSKLIIKDTGVCVETCPRIHTPDPITGDLIENPDGMYQNGNNCLKKCENNTFIYREFCLKKCPNETYEEEELEYDPETGEKGYRRFCKVCTPHKCQKSCSVNAELNVSNIKNLQGCEVLNSNLIISRPQVDHAEQRRLPPELEANDLKALNSLRIVNGFVRIQSNNIQNLSFLSNLEIIRGNIELIQNKFSFVVISSSLKALGLNKLKSVENGIIHLQTDQLCLYDTINWNLVLNKKDSFFIKKNNSKDNCTPDGYVCDDACSGCWSAGPKSCQLCKTYKLDDSCVDQCENKFLNGKYIYLNDSESRECGYCHPECKNGCTGPSEYECKKCNNFILPLNGSQPVKCVEKCPISHYSDTSDPDNKICLPCFKDCYGCTGPKDYITQDGCTKCSSALVSNDPSYSILKCIVKDAYNCSNNEFGTLVPQNLRNHPLKGKHVCRKCNAECDECYENGVKLHTQCKKCKNFYSNSTGECVKNCNIHHEYLDDRKMSCLSCNRECRLGCSGSSPFQCNQCRTYRIKLQDLERTLLKGINSKLKTRGQATSSDLNPEILNRFVDLDSNVIKNTVDLNDLKELYIDFYTKRKPSPLIEDNNESTVFCIPECPEQLPFKTADYFCTDDPKRIAQLIISNEWKVFMTFISITLIILFTLLLILIAFWRYKLKMEQIDKKNEEKFFCATYDENGGFDESKKVDMSDLRLVKLNELKLEKMLGRGAFGIVYKGYYMPFDQSNYKVRVAIKVLNKYKQSDEKSVAKLSHELINEAKVMASVDHEYCLRLTALCLVEPMMLVTQLMNYGSVVSFFQKYRDRVTEIMLLTWSKQIAEGMTYLESRGIVHRDLAARNILVKKFDHIKITDFGLARVLDSNEEGIYVYEYSLVPFKWLAIESIKNRLFNHKSDVWSYGICLWEIFTFCSKPYAEYPETEPLTIYNCILKGTRLAKPQMASLDVYTILLRCWLENPLARPDFKTLLNEFAKMCLDPKRYLSIKDVDFNNPFKTIDDNTQDLLKEFKQDVYEERLSNNGSMSDISTDKNNDKLNEEDIDSELGSMTGADDLSANNNTTHSKRFINNIFTSLKPNKHFNLNEKHSNVITFKRSNQLQKNQLNDKESDESKMNKNRNFIKKFLHSGLKLPTRLDSQMSTGTASTYLSYSCSSDSTPSPKIDKNKQKLNFNFYEEQEGLLNVEKNLYDYSLSPTRSNSNNSSRSNNTSIDQMKPIYKVQRLNSRNSEITNKTNSDYLEPIMTNVIQNLEYFSENNHQKQMIPQQPAPQPPPRIIITEDTPKLPSRNYYNDSMSVVLDNNIKRQTLI